MKQKTQKSMIQELYQAVIGIHENPDENGLVGDVKRLNGRVKGNETRSKVNQALITLIISGVLTFIGIQVW